MEIKTTNDSYLTATTVENGALVEFLNEGETKQINGQDGKVKDVYNFDVKSGDKELTYTPNKTSLKIFTEAYGTDSTAWVGKIWKVKLVDMMISGKLKKVLMPEIVPIPDCTEESI